MPRLPWVPWDIDRWRISDSREEFSLAERGLYREMLDYQWQKGSVPEEVGKLARVTGSTVEEITPLLPAVLSKFDRVKGGRLVNRDMDAIKQEKQSLSGKRAEANAARKTHGGGRPRKTTNETTNQQQANNNASISISESNSDSPEDFQATLETLKDEHPGSYHADDCGRALSNLTGKGYALEDILISHRNAQKAWETRIPPDLEKWLWSYSPGNKLVGFEKENKPKSALAAMEGL